MATVFSAHFLRRHLQGFDGRCRHVAKQMFSDIFSLKWRLVTRLLILVANSQSLSQPVA